MSWERSRYIPWSRIKDVSGTDNSYESQKERLHRTLAREANREKEEIEISKNAGSQSSSSTSPSNVQNNTSTTTFVPPEVIEQQKKKGFLNSGVEYTTADMIRTVAFGGCIGAITGSVFGFMDSMRTAQESAIIKNASNSAKVKYMIQGTSRSGTLFGLYFSGFQTLKYGIRVAADPGWVYEIIGAGALSLGALVVKPATRPSIPYAAMLIAMDTFSIYMKDD